MKVQISIKDTDQQYTRQMNNIPRIGEIVYIENQYYTIENIIWNLQLSKKCWDCDVIIFCKINHD